MNKKTIKDFNLNNQKVLIRVDFNVPIKNGQITSNKRILASLPTIKYALDNNAKVVVFSHLGRIKTVEDTQKNTLEPVAKELSRLLNQDVIFVNQTKGKSLEKAVNNLKPQEVLMFQNTRFEDLNNQSESKNNLDLGKYWASLGDIFINDAFGTAHRKHASNVGIASYIASSGVGFLVEKELKMLSKALNNFEKPLVGIIGGAKVSDKITVIKNLLKKVDKLLIGGGMAYTFLKAQGKEIGKSLLEKDYLNLAKKLLEEGKDKIVLPIDHALSSNYKDNPREISKNENIDKDKMALDIGPKTIKLYTKELQGAKTVIWNGPMGVAEFENFKEGTEKIAQAIASQENVFSIIGGGDSAAAAIKLGFEKQFTHISTGGGASLEFLEGKVLPGIQSVQNKE